MELHANGGSNSTNYALQIALQTLTERCSKLQERLSQTEEENRQMRKKLQNHIEPSAPSCGVSSIALDNMKLRARLAELTQQRAELEDQISMVTSENNSLWSRLSQIFKEHQSNADANKAMTSRGPAKAQLTTTTPSQTSEFQPELCTDSLAAMRREVLKQAQQLAALNKAIAQRKPTDHCPSCTARRQKPVESANQHQVKPEESRLETNCKQEFALPAPQTDDSTCPMCGEAFVDAPFDDFVQHVSAHFIGESFGREGNVERNFEYTTSHAVGNF